VGRQKVDGTPFEKPESGLPLSGFFRLYEGYVM